MNVLFPSVNVTVDFRTIASHASMHRWCVRRLRATLDGSSIFDGEIDRAFADHESGANGRGSLKMLARFLLTNCLINKPRSALIRAEMKRVSVVAVVVFVVVGVASIVVVVAAAAVGAVVVIQWLALQRLCVLQSLDVATYLFGCPKSSKPMEDRFVVLLRSQISRPHGSPCHRS
ncbi:hypothetical protein KIN20_001079 [Parelaphostrongylus tenuis]|uniref:Uncharacterized protein n=1 Tax=Parelaphostrongylus tenuis TaxID=148309 RepID=A0AAD5LT51_PARTN|nr:hypothetical protein KIN20_001079 [Parelaphostrongylus tenuis]